MKYKDLLTSNKVYYLNNGLDISNGCAVAVGNFDGVHLGHKALLGSLVAEGKRLGVPCAVVSFDPLDNPKNAPLLATQNQKMRLLKEIGVDFVVSLSYSELRNVTARDFVLEFLYGTLSVKSIVCGYDFRFGKDRAGDVALIKQLLPNEVAVITPDIVKINGNTVSSTLIRSLLSSGDIKTANMLLGREFSFEAEVVHGAKLGRNLGFPTINQIYPASLAKLPYGVYATRTVFEDGKAYNSVSNFGVKPTVNGTDPILETHLLGFDGDCYGKILTVYFVDFIRKEQKFSSLDELKQQIERDKITALSILSKGE